MKRGSPEHAKIGTNTAVVALSWGFPYHNCTFHSAVPNKAIEVKPRLLQLQVYEFPG